MAKIEILYHITKFEYLPSILTQGLQINSGKNGFVKTQYLPNYYAKYKIQPIFLTSDIDFIVKKDLTKDFVEKNKLFVLKFRARKIEVEPEFHYLDWRELFRDELTYGCVIANIKNRIGKTFICRNNIPKELIIDIDRLYWK